MTRFSPIWRIENIPQRKQGKLVYQRQGKVIATPIKLLYPNTTTGDPDPRIEAKVDKVPAGSHYCPGDIVIWQASVCEEV